MDFPKLLRMLRLDAGLSLEGLAGQVHYSRGHVHNVESGARPATADFAAAADRALCSEGLLEHQWRRDQDRARDAHLASAMTAALRRSRDLAQMPGLDVDDLAADAADLAVEYLSAPPGPMLQQAHQVRQEVTGRLRQRHHRPGERAELYVAAGRLSGVLAYAALDLGDARAAMEHCRAALRCAEFAGDTELLVWVRGTQSLIARFEQDFVAASGFVDEGLQHAGRVPGTGLARLLCGRAQCLANLGDSAGSNAALDAAWAARDEAVGQDAVGGLFTFSAAKQQYYAGSALIWLPGRADNERAAEQAGAAIGLWQEQGPAERSLDDEHLAHVYLATARAQLGDVEGAAAAVEPVLSLPAEMQISWIVKRMGRLAGVLSGPRFAGSRSAVETVEAIRAAG
ncbi:helix-turn-helix domain-containing protein [Kitasatospora cineracea]|uniref:Helix-turn-helix protein n=1 Tax=Kitasatospora cineracea TaxID=88074 RepID=A0A3N4RTI4_9ACTN|nr:helix-turn-helix transcriptional regulator [Kitasatospora cineracea]RPE27324.1 helix-turn-helix protein [Kitasatospora cineracea]